MSLSDDELARYARQIVLPAFGGQGQQRLSAASVGVVGAGGIGSAVIPVLAGAGIGRLTIVDGDTVDLSNLHRQPIFRTNQQGASKARCAADFVQALNPHVAVHAVAERITPANAAATLVSHDLILDGTDNFATRLLVSDTAVALGIPLLSAAAVQFQGQVGLFRARPCYRCFVGDAFDTDDCDTCAENGVLGATTAAVGGFAALLAIRALARVGEDPAGGLHLFDGMTGAWRRISLPADPQCRVCGAS